MTRMLEILTLGAALRGEAAHQCACVNQSYLLVHQVLARAFADDPHLTPAAALQPQLSDRLRIKLSASCGAEFAAA
ncbi:MAG: hypothetical protein KBA31_09035 [Alphaproteobacteria bacterium]|nr:hypothetical protein [Alphaproteobacteria bacterium]